MPPVRTSQNPTIAPGDQLSIGQNGRARHVVVAEGMTPLMAGLGLALLAGEGAPVDGVQASETINPTGDDNAILWTAVQAGEAGDNITVEYVDPGANDAELEVAVGEDGAIAISLATDENGDVTTTAIDVIDEVDAGEGAWGLVALLVTAVADAVDEDAGGSVGLLEAVAATPLAGGVGTGIGAAPGSLYSDFDTPALYMNGGTAALPAWTLVGPAA